ncbi:hypothetical protein BDR04DRAFT_1087358 [Suillus decipiens]|nr:hypothetical protein BDR04DRAFT_1087358 [Suillus decipiens]
MRRLRYNHKGISARAPERDEEQRAIFMNHIAETLFLWHQMIMQGPTYLVENSR